MEKFPEDVVTVLESFDIFNGDMVPNDADVDLAIYRSAEIDVFYYFLDADEGKASKLRTNGKNLNRKCCH